MKLTFPESDSAILSGRGEDRSRQIPGQPPDLRLMVVEFSDLLNLVLRDAGWGI